MTDIKYMTVVEPVLEVSLLGKSDFGAWQTLFKNEAVRLPESSETSEVILSAVEARFMGLQFREFSVSIRLNESDLFLAHAFNSIAVFALAERRFFRTPYYHANLIVTPEQIKVSRKQITLFEARRSASAQVIQQEAECDRYQIYLPHQSGKIADRSHYFHAKLEGETQHYAPEDTVINLPSTGEEAIFELLRQSNFRVTDWSVRENATHSKSKTMMS